MDGKLQLAVVRVRRARDRKLIPINDIEGRQFWEDVDAITTALNAQEAELARLRTRVR